MSIIDGMIGITIDLTPEQLEGRIEELLLEGETIEKGYQIVRDLIFFTNRRIIILNYQGLTGKKIEYQVIPYKTINRYIIETPGNLDTEYSLKLYVSGCFEPIERSFRSTIDIYELQRILAGHVL